MVVALMLPQRSSSVVAFDKPFVLHGEFSLAKPPIRTFNSTMNKEMNRPERSDLDPIRPRKTNAPQTVVMWVMWCAFAGALIMYRFYLVGKSTNTHSIVAPESLFGWLSYLIPVAIVMSLRWLVIPRLRLPFLVMSPFVVGFAFAEVLTFFGIFIFPKQFALYYLTSWFLILQLMPLWRTKTDQPVA